MPARPSTVLMFHLNATRSRHKPSSTKSSAAAAQSPFVKRFIEVREPLVDFRSDGWDSGCGHGLLRADDGTRPVSLTDARRAQIAKGVEGRDCGNQAATPLLLSGRGHAS
jgi:hypothetical protein